MEIKELGHAVLYVRNLDRSAAFYRDVLGFRQIGERVPGMPAVGFSSGRTHHELLLIEVGPNAQDLPAGRRVGLYHLGLKVGDTDEELIEAYRAVRDGGGTIVGTADHTVTHSLYILDPDGNELELYIDVAGVDWRSDPTVFLTPTRPLRVALA